MSINFVDKGAGLQGVIRAAGHWLAQIDGEWRSSDDAAVQAIIDTYDPLPEVQAKKWEAIKAERERRKGLGVQVGAARFHSDPDSRIQQLGLVLMGAGIPQGLQWRAMNGQFVTMTPQLAQQIFAATAAQDQAIFAAAEAHRAAINALTDWQAVEAYDFTGGWPA